MRTRAEEVERDGEPKPLGSLPANAPPTGPSLGDDAPDAPDAPPADAPPAPKAVDPSVVGGRVGRCTACAALVRFAKSPSGATLVMDVDTAPEGAGLYVSNGVASADRVDGAARHMIHAASCRV